MTPQERQLIDDLFDRLAKLETTQRDPDAQAAIADGLRRAPNAVYALVQTVLVQDEALKQAEAHIRELEEGNRPQQQSGGFLDSMRDSLRGPSSSRGSVPNVRPGESDAPRGAVWNTGQTGYQPDPRAGADLRQGNPGGGFGGGLFGGGNQQGGAPGGGGGSFLGTAAATAAGVIGGSMLMNSMRGMFGGGSHQQSFGDTASSTKSPWDNNNDTQSGGDLARDAGLNDVGKGGRDDNSRQSLADNSSYDQNNDDDYDNNDHDDDYDGDDDFGGGSDDSDFA